MRRDNAAGGKMAGMFRRGLAAVGGHVMVASASRRDSEGVRGGIAEWQRESVGCVQIELVGVSERENKAVEKGSKGDDGREREH